MSYRIAPEILGRTFSHFRECGQSRRECQVLWTSSWNSPETIEETVHPEHHASGDGFVLDDRWLSEFWLELGQKNMGIRVQVHTHPHRAFHSRTDDEFPIIHRPGFLSLVIPNFGMGPVGFANAYLAEIQPDGQWNEIPISSRLVLA